MRKEAEERYNLGAKDLNVLKIGTHVVLQNPISKRWDKVGIIVAIGRNRDYFVKHESRRVYWRNKRCLRIFKPSFPVATSTKNQSTTPIILMLPIKISDKTIDTRNQILASAENHSPKCPPETQR